MAFVVKCLDCGHVAPYFPTSINCPRCGSQWREAEYDYESIARTLPLQLPGRPFDLWRYRELLPVRNTNSSLKLGEGGTPLLPAVNLGMMLGTPNLYIKEFFQSFQPQTPPYFKLREVGEWQQSYRIPPV
jgi:threonine synthase